MSKLNFLMRRFLAITIDIIILSILEFALDNYTSLFQNELNLNITLFLITFSYFFLFEGILSSSSPGKKLLGLFVLSSDIHSSKYKSFFLRAFIEATLCTPFILDAVKNLPDSVFIYQVVLFTYLFIISFNIVQILRDKRTRFLHDLATNTQVLPINEFNTEKRPLKGSLITATISVVIALIITKSINFEEVFQQPTSTPEVVEIERVLSNSILAQLNITNTLQITSNKDPNNGYEFIVISAQVPFTEAKKLITADFLKIFSVLKLSQVEYLIGKNRLLLEVRSKRGFARTSTHRDLAYQIFKTLENLNNPAELKATKENLSGTWKGLAERNKYEWEMKLSNDGKYQIEFKFPKKPQKNRKEQGMWFANKHYYVYCTFPVEVGVCNSFKILNLDSKEFHYQSIQHNDIFKANRVKEEKSGS